MLNKLSGIDPKMVKKDYSDGKKRGSIIRALYLPGPTNMEYGMDKMSNPYEDYGNTEPMKKGNKKALINERSRFHLKNM